MENKNIKTELIESLLEFSNSNYASLFFRIMEGKNAVLHFLNTSNNDVTPTIISQKLEISKARVTAIINVLSKEELIIIEKDKNDKRKMYVKITSKGKAYLLNKLNTIESEMATLVNTLGIEKTSELVEMLKLINQSSKESDGIIYD